MPSPVAAQRAAVAGPAAPAVDLVHWRAGPRRSAAVVL